MMAGTGPDIGGLWGSETDTELSSHQDLPQVGADCGGTRLDSVGCKGNGNVRDDLSGSYVFVSDVGEVSVYDPIVDENCNAESKPGVDLKDATAVEVKNGEVVVETGGNDQASAVEENNCVLTDKEVALHGEFFVENATSGVLEDGQPDSEVKVEDQVESESSPKPRQNQESKTNADIELEESQEAVVELVQAGELSEKRVKAVEQDVVVSPADLGGDKQSNAAVFRADGCKLAKVEVDVEGGKFKQSELKLEEESLESKIRITRSVDYVSHELEKERNKFKQMKDFDNDAELGESLETVIKLAEAGELSDKSVRGVVKQDIIAPPADFGESKQSNAVVLEADGCELAKVEAGIEVVFGEGKSKEKAELKSVEESLESEITITESVDFVSHELEEDGNKFKNLKDLDTDIEVGVQLGNEIDAVAYAADDYRVRVVEQDIIVPPADFGESKQSNTVVSGADGCELAKVEAGIEEGKFTKKQTEPKSVEESLESEITITESVDFVSHELEEDGNKFKNMKDLDSDIEVGVQLGNEIDAVAYAADDYRVRIVEQGIIVPPADFGESKQSDTVVLGADGCELAKVEAGIEFVVGDEKSKEQTELNSVEESLESEITVTESVDFVSPQLEEDGNKFKNMKDLDSDIEVGVQMVNEIDAVAYAAGDYRVRVADQDIIAPPADFGESKQFDNVVLGADGCELAKVEAGIEVDEGEVKSTKEQTELMSVEESLESEITITESVDFVSHELEEDDNKFKNMKDLDSDIEVGVQLGDEIGAVAYAAKDYKVSRGNKLDECIDGSQSVNELDSTPSKAETLCSIAKVPTESGENLTADTDDGAAVEDEPSGSVIVLRNGTVNLVNLDSDRSKMSAELTGHVPAKICESFLASIDAGAVSYQRSMDADCEVGLIQGYEAEIAIQDTDGTLATETATMPVSDQPKILQSNLGEQIAGGTNSPELNGNPDDAQSNCIVLQVQSDGSFTPDSNGGTIIVPKVVNLACPVTENKSELETKNVVTEDAVSGLLSPTDGTKSEIEVVYDLSSCPPNDVRSGLKIEFGTIDSAEVVSKLCVGDVLSKSQVSNGDIEYAWKRAISTTNSVVSESCADMNFKSDVQYCSDMPSKDATVAESKVLSESVIKGGPASLLECSIGDSVDGQNLGVVAKAKPFQFFVKFPRIDDDKLREQIKDAQLLVEEKTVRRNDIRSDIDMKKANLQSLNDRFEATKSDERAARRLVKLKRQEIESIQDRINRVKNSISVMDITNRVTHMEYMIEHETQPLKEEMQLLREINQMKKLRDQISSNVCSSEEVSHALSQIEPMEMQLKTLKKELSDLKAKVLKAEAAVIQLGKEYNDESKMLRELQAQFRAANDVRQDAYKDFLDLKRQLHEKSKHYWMYKDDVKTASDYALNGDREELYRLCTNQVENFMELWNKNDEFREDYIRCNMKSTMRRLKTSDGRSLGPDDEVPVMPVYVAEKEDMQLSSPSRTTYPSLATILKQENTAPPVKSERVGGESMVVTEPKRKMLKSKPLVKPNLGNGFHIGSGHLDAGETKEEEKQQTEEELELVRKADILRKEEIAAKLKEQLRQEERVKAQEALERKKRNAEKAQMRAVLRAQKEAEQKEKEREKRLRKKEKKNADGETGLELQTDSTKDDESKDSSRTKPRKTSHFNKYSKPKATIPPALRNRGKRRLKQFMWWIFAGLIVLFIFLVGNGGAFGNLKPRKDGRFFGNHWSPQAI